MDIILSETGIYLLAALAVGAVAGWLIRTASNAGHIEKLNDDWQAQLNKSVVQKNTLNAEAIKLRSLVAAQEALVHKRETEAATIRTQMDSALEREKLMTKNIFTLRAEREDFKSKVTRFQNALHTIKTQSAQLEAEFVKSGDIYKRELAKSFESRQLLEAKMKNTKMERASIGNLLQASRSEHDSVNRMLAAAKARLDEFDTLERSVIRLEAENAQLNHDTAQLRQENNALQRDGFEQEELKVQNKELAQVLKSMETSRKQYEVDANQYRERVDVSEKESDTLRVRLDEVEVNFLQMEKQQQKALKDARDSATAQAGNNRKVEKQDEDDLQTIVGIGRVFEQSLHEIGITSFRQIANFDVSDIARVNAALKEFKGRLEQDDWIGQARELLFQKYGES